MQCGAILSGQFSPISSWQTLHGSPIRARYGVSVVRFKTNSCSAAVIATLFVKLQWIGPRYSVTWLYIRLNYTAIYHMKVHIHAHPNLMRLYSELKNCLLFFHSLYFFSEITSFYTNHLVLPYSINLSSTLSYHIFGNQFTFKILLC